MAIFKALSPVIPELFEAEALNTHAFKITHADQADEVTLELQHVEGAHYLLKQGHHQRPVYIHQMVDRYQVQFEGRYYVLQKQTRAAAEQGAAAADQVQAPLTGKVIQVNVQPGQTVTLGDTLVILESMKMETALTAPRDGVVESVHCVAGDQVSNEQVLIQLQTEDAETEDTES